MHSTEVIGPEHILLAGVSLQLSAWKFYRLGGCEGVRERVVCERQSDSQCSMHTLFIISIFLIFS